MSISQLPNLENGNSFILCGTVFCPLHNIKNISEPFVWSFKTEIVMYFTKISQLQSLSWAWFLIMLRDIKSFYQNQLDFSPICSKEAKDIGPSQCLCILSLMHVFCFGFPLPHHLNFSFSFVLFGFVCSLCMWFHEILVIKVGN